MVVWKCRPLRLRAFLPRQQCKRIRVRAVALVLRTARCGTRQLSELGVAGDISFQGHFISRAFQIKAIHTEAIMDLQVLKIFRAVAIEGGVARAAEHLHCVQSNVSTRLAQLEENLGTLLFQRQGRKMVITPAGTQLLHYAERLLELAEEAKDAVSAEKACAERLRVGSISVAAAVWLPSLLANYHREHPSVRLDVKISTAERVFSDLMARKLDVGIVDGTILDTSFESEELFREKVILVTELSQGPVMSSRDIAGQTVIVLKQNCTSQSLLEAWFAEQGLKISKVLEVDRVEAMLSLVAAGSGIAIMPDSLVNQRELGNSVRCHELPEKFADMQISVVWRKDGLLYPARRAFIEAMRKRKYRH